VTVIDIEEIRGVTIRQEIFENWWYVDCDDFSFGLFETHEDAITKRDWLLSQLAQGWTAKEVYQGASGSTEIANEDA
jgi:hypothetical protein